MSDFPESGDSAPDLPADVAPDVAPDVVPPPSPPRVWTAVVVYPCALPLSMLGAFAVAVPVGIWILITGGTEAQIQRFFGQPAGFLLLVVASQLTFLCCAIVPAVFSPVPVRERLGLVKGRVSWTWVPMLMLATLFWSQVGDLLVRQFPEPSEHLLAFTRMFTEATLTWGIILTAALSILPGFCEELVGRGYVQRRLLQRWPAGWALAFTALVFAGQHLDPQHIVGVLPVAFWLSYVAWRTDSTLPGMACHFFMNAVAFTTILAWNPDAPAGNERWLDVLFFAVSLPACVLSVWELERTVRRREPDKRVDG